MDQYSSVAWLGFVATDSAFGAFCAVLERFAYFDECRSGFAPENRFYGVSRSFLAALWLWGWTALYGICFRAVRLE